MAVDGRVDWEDLSVAAFVTALIGGPIGYLLAASPLYWLWSGFRPDSPAQFVVISAVIGLCLAAGVVWSGMRR
jgi:hypothetical protein